MLTLTDPAATAAKTIISDSEETADTAGLRIAAEEAATATEVTIGLVDSPDDGDEVIDEKGARIFLEPKLASWLDDKLLDVSLREGLVTFVIRDLFEEG
jgi:iron-sulfur cluster assembly protein